ncbi:MAG: tyrosine-type recombinase/integrase [Corynebacterium variabile]|uniref:tyrosine-type recombinase/integrase n=1 Tax=Corynebacterium variabile TaxID=1727 RepID=UPI003F993748
MRRLPSKRYQAKYTGPDGQWHKAPHTFDAKEDAEGWLRDERRLISMDLWFPPEVRAARAADEAERTSLTVRDMCEKWLSAGHLKSSTVSSHRKRLELRVYSTALADEPAVEVDRTRVRLWWSEVQERWPDTGSTNSYAYKRLRTAFQWAVDEVELLPSNPVKIKGAGSPPRSDIRDRPLITMSEAQALAEGVIDRMTSPMELLLWCGLRIGELLELRRKDVHGLSGTGPVTLRIRRNAEREEEPKVDPVTGEPVMNRRTGKQVMRQFMVSHDTPKTSASNRDVGVPARVAEHLRAHCREHVGKGPDALIIPRGDGEVMLDTAFRGLMAPGKARAGRDDVGPHDCRRFYCTLLVNTPGVTLEEARRLVGHEDVSQLMEYQRAATGYENRAATALDALVPVTAPTAVVPGAPGEAEDQDNDDDGGQGNE